MIGASAAALACQWRGEEVESVHLGHLVCVDAEGQVVFSRGDPDVAIFARSALKPIQALPLLLGGAADAFGLTDEAVAIALASHAGQPMHRAAVQQLLDQAGLHANQLQCGTHAPYHEPTARALIAAGQAPDVLHCNCSGKHAGMLAVCRHAGWDLASYRDVDHPLQRWIRALLLEHSGCADIGHAVDGCGVPVWRLPLVGLARAFGRLHPRFVALMTAHAPLISGDGRLDTVLMQAGGGTLVAKIGGEAVHAGLLPGLGVAWAMKIADGNKRAIGPALARALGELGYALPETEALLAHTHPQVRNNHQEVVGRVTAAW